MPRSAPPSPRAPRPPAVFRRCDHAAPGALSWAAGPSERDASGGRFVGVGGVVTWCLLRRLGGVGEFVDLVLVRALEVVANRLLRRGRQGPHHLANASPPTFDGLPLRHTGCRHDLRRHALDLVDAAVVVTRVRHGLLFCHGRLVLLLRHADRTEPAAVEELPHHGLVAGQQHFARTEHDQVLAEQHAHVVGHRAGDVDVVRDDQDRAVDLRVDVDQQLAQVRGTHRVESGVGFVAEDDLRVEHQRAGQPGALAHTAGYLAGELLLVAGEAHHVELLHDDVTDFAFLLLGVLTQRERGVVVDVHRAEQRTVLEHDAEQLADLVQLLRGAFDDVAAVDDDAAALRAQQADQRLQEHRLAGTRRAQEHAYLTRRDLERDIFPDSLGTEGFRQSLNLNSDAHAFSFRRYFSATCLPLVA